MSKVDHAFVGRRAENVSCLFVKMMLYLPAQLALCRSKAEDFLVLQLFLQNRLLFSGRYCIITWCHREILLAWHKKMMEKSPSPVYGARLEIV